MLNETKPAKRCRGRPPKASALSSTDRAALARRSARKAGGGTVNLILGPESMRALKALAPPGGRTDLIERLLIDEIRRRAET